MSQVQVGFGSVVGDEYFPVLDGVHGARVYVDIRVKFLHGNLVAAGFQQPSQGCGRNALSQAGDYAACDKYIFNCHIVILLFQFRLCAPPPFQGRELRL